jgi:hypothetical protein
MVDGGWWMVDGGWWMDYRFFYLLSLICYLRSSISDSRIKSAGPPTSIGDPAGFRRKPINSGKGWEEVVSDCGSERMRWVQAPLIAEHRLLINWV